MLKIAPYQLGFSSRTRPLACIGQTRIVPLEGYPSLQGGFIDP